LMRREEVRGREMRRVGVAVWEGGVRLYDYGKEARRKERHSLIHLELLKKSDALLHRLGKG